MEFFVVVFFFFCEVVKVLVLETERVSSEDRQGNNRHVNLEYENKQGNNRHCELGV